ncbi:MAG: hypothetical protein Q9169_004624 [Polycauliona sp. 2 TL-2023]
MAQRKRSHEAAMTAGISASEEDDNRQSMGDSHGSQGSDDQIVKDMARALKESTKRRRIARRGKIEKDYDDEMGQLEASVTANLNDISNRAYVGA